MPEQTTSPFPDTPFWRQYQARTSGILSWADLDAFWVELAASGQDWYVFDPFTDPPESPATADVFKTTLLTAEVLVNQRRDRSHSGAVYVDDRNAPTMVKVFDPVHMGSSCGCSGEAILPRWIFSHIKPDPLPVPEPPSKKSFLGRLARAK